MYLCRCLDSFNRRALDIHAVLAMFAFDRAIHDISQEMLATSLQALHFAMAHTTFPGNTRHAIGSVAVSRRGTGRVGVPPLTQLRAAYITNAQDGRADSRRQPHRQA
jgi:hypothetical protein